MKMKKLWIRILLAYGMLIPTLVNSQNLPGGELPLRYNSSFAGVTGGPRIYSNVKYHYNTISGFRNNSKSTHRRYGFEASYDHFLPSIRSGIGVAAYQSNSFVYEDNSKSWFNSQTMISAAIAPKFSIKGKYTISPSLDINFLYGYFNYNAGSHSRNGFSSRAGILFNTNKYYIGYSVSLFENQYGKYNYYPYGSFHSLLIMGYTFQKNEDSRFAFSPQIVIPMYKKSEVNGSIIDGPYYNLSFRYGNFLLGYIGYKYLKPAGFQVGWQYKNWRVLLNNHIYNGQYDGILTLRYMFNKKNGYRMF